MQLQTLQSAITHYCHITNETVDLSDYTIPQADCLFNPKTNKYLKVLPSNEFIIWAIGEREGLSFFQLDQCYGFMKNFVPFIKDIMRITNTEWIVTATQRNPKSHVKKWKMEHLSHLDYEYEGRFYHVLKGHVSNLK